MKVGTQLMSGNYSCRKWWVFMGCTTTGFHLLRRLEWSKDMVNELGCMIPTNKIIRRKNLGIFMENDEPAKILWDKQQDATEARG